MHEKNGTSGGGGGSSSSSSAAPSHPPSLQAVPMRTWVSTSARMTCGCVDVWMCGCVDMIGCWEMNGVLWIA